jgi:histidinol-phosphatase (PHP family)
MKYLCDYHTHSNYSFDATGSINEICRVAEKKGLKEICITDHYEYGVPEEEWRNLISQGYLNEILEIKEIFKGRVRVKIGIEVGQPHLSLKESQKFLKRIPYDYVIGSIHRVPPGIYAKNFDYSKYKIGDILELYLNEIKKMLAVADFDCLGHMDLIKRYGFNFYNERITLCNKKDLLEEVLKLIISKNKGIEINTSGLRGVTKESMPGIDVLRLYKKLGGEILTLGSDSHNASDVGTGILDGIELAKEAGFKYITIFNTRETEYIMI